MGAVENLAVAQLPLHVAHDALPQGGHAGEVVRVCLVHDAKDALPASVRHDSPSALVATLASHSRASSAHGVTPSAGLSLVSAGTKSGGCLPSPRTHRESPPPSDVPLRVPRG